MKKITLIGFLLLSLPSWAIPTGRYKIIVDNLRSVESSNPTISSAFSIGQNDDKEEIMAIRVSTTPTKADPSKIAHLIVATHHGNELAAPQLAMAFLSDLIARYRSTDLWRGQLADTEWVIVPVLNVSGYNAAQREEKSIDPNREYPGPCAPKATPKLKSIQTIMNYASSRIFSGTVSIHGYVGSFTFPWGVNATGDETLDHNFYSSITAKAVKHNGYRSGTHTAVVYPANGTYEDWTYWKYGMWTSLIELDSGSAQDITDTVAALSEWFDQLNISPSTQNAFKYTCTRPIVDLHLE